MPRARRRRARPLHRPGWGGYTVDEAALRHGASVTGDTTEPEEAYAPVAKREPTSYREGWLPD